MPMGDSEKGRRGEWVTGRMGDRETGRFGEGVEFLIILDS